MGTGPSSGAKARAVVAKNRGSTPTRMLFRPSSQALRSALRIVNPAKYHKMPYAKLMENPPLVGE